MKAKEQSSDTELDLKDSLQKDLKEESQDYVPSSIVYIQDDKQLFNAEA